MAAAALAAAVACGDSSGPGGAERVALLVNDNFVEYDTSDYGAEASQMEFTLASVGATVTPVTDVDSASLHGVLSQAQALVIPEQEGSSALTDSLTPGALALIREFVDSNGGLLIVNSDANGLVLLDSLWGYNIQSGSGDNHYTLDPAEASGTAFAGGPGIVWDNDAVYSVDTASLPAGALAIYGSGTDAVVVVIPQGRGTVVLLCWDWYSAAPHGMQDGGWIEMLRRALRS